MIQFSRRTFLASSLAVGAVAAAESSESRWFLTPGEPVRIGLVDCGTEADHVALFAAIPRAQIVGLVSLNGRAAQQYIAQLYEWGKPRAKVYGDLSRMLQDSSLDAICLTGKRLSEPSVFKRVVKAGFPVLADFPPEVPRSEQQTVLDVLRSAKTPVHFRIDHLAEARVEEIRNWLLRSGGAKMRATLVSPIGAGSDQVHTAGTLSLYALFGVCSQPATALQSWLSSTLRRIDCEKGHRLDKVSVPNNPYGIEYLYLRPYGGYPKLSRLLFESRGGSLDVPIFDVPNPRDCFRTTIRFLSRVNSRQPVDNSDSLFLQFASILMQSVLTR